MREIPTHKDDLVSLYENGLLEEVFVTSTSSTVEQVSELLIGDVKIELEENEFEIGKELQNLVWQIQYGEVDHPFSVRVD